MPELHDPSQPPRKHKVIHWNPEQDEGQAAQKPAMAAYFRGFAVALAAVALALGAYFLFFRDTGQSATATAGAAAAADPRQAFASLSRAEFVQESVRRKLEAARVMPTAGHDVLRQMLINIEKEVIEANDFMRRASYARAIEHYGRVEKLIDDFTTVVRNKQGAQELYDRFLVRSEELERGKPLNQEAFEAAFAAASEGKQFLDMGSFSPALQRLEQATSKLGEVEATLNDTLQQNRAQGHRAIAQGESEEAVAAFTRVLEIDPSNEDAIKQIERAKTARETFSLLQAAGAAEQAGEFEDALTRFEQAFAMDAASARAQSGISRLRRKIQDRDFAYNLTLANEAEAELRYEDAIASYEAALEIFPERYDLEDAIAAARANKRQNDIVTRITRAYDFEREHDWVQARDLFQDLVQMEPDLKEAKEGLLRTGRMIRSILRYEKLIDVAKVEARRADFQLAIRTFDRAMQSKPAYLPLDEESERLRAFLHLQSQPVAVQFTSDNDTWVSVQGPTQLKPEKFESQMMNLLPGKYYIIGRKKGYQDVRLSFQIRGGRAQDPVAVVCNVKSNY